MIKARIRHLVLLKFRTDVSEHAIEERWQGLRDLQGPIKGILDIHTGRSVSPEQIERGYMHGFSIDFESRDALLAYLGHPEHQKFGATLLELVEGGIDGVLVFDLPLYNNSQKS